MQLFLLATGETDKLHPLTVTMPSPLMPLANKPVMTYVLQLLARQEIKQAWVGLYRLPGSIEAYFGTGRRWGVKLDYVLQREAWGTAGTLKWASQLLTETFIVLPADALVDVDLREALAHHRQRGSVATAVWHTTPVATDKQIGLGANEQVVAVGAGAGQIMNGYSTGVYIFEPQALAHIPERTPFAIHHQLLPALLAAGLPVQGYQMRGYWNPLQTAEQYQQAQSVLLRNAASRQPALPQESALHFMAVDGREISPGVWVEHHNVIHPSVRIAPPVYIGTNCYIGQDVELGPEAVVGANVIIDDEATIKRSTILDYTYVGQLVNIENRLVRKNLVIDVLSGESMEMSDKFLLGQTQQTAVTHSGQRLLDSGLALLLLLLALPLWLVLLPLLLLTHRRVLVAETRIGVPPAAAASQPQMPQAFSLWRFITRNKNGRVSWLGRLLEKLEWHRLPELWNVLKGDIRFVGVYPLSPEEMEQITEEWQQKRNEYPSGFTGLWYTQTQPHHNLDDLLIADVYYVATRTWVQDLKLCYQTPISWRRRLSKESFTN